MPTHRDLQTHDDRPVRGGGTTLDEQGSHLVAAISARAVRQPPPRCLEAVAVAVATADLGHIEATVRQAHAMGAKLPQVLMAVKVGRCLGYLPRAVRPLAWQVVHGCGGLAPFMRAA